jgi:benzoate-CoA ligase family protein
MTLPVEPQILSAPTAEARPIRGLPDTFNMAAYFLDDRIAEGRGDRTAVIDDSGRYTYDQVHDMSGRLAGALWDLGIRPEDRCLIGLFDSVEFAASFFGVLKAGGVVAMVNPELPDADYEHYLSYTRCRALIADEALLRRIAHLLPRCDCLRAVIVVGGAPLPRAAPDGLRLMSWEDVLATSPRATYPTSKDDPAVWLFTSGSTGKPKAAVHMHHDFPYNTEGYAKQVLGIREDDVTVGVPKLFFGYATGTNLMFPFAVGATAVLFRERATPERLCHLIARHQGTILTSVPTMINKMLEHDPRADLRPLRLCTSAGEALPEELYHRWKQAYGVEILDGIGSAELFHIYISNRLGRVRPGSLGQLVPGYTARVVRSDGSDAQPGESGQLWVKGDSAALCYWQAHEKSKETLRGDWVVSGDLFHRDEEGFFYYDGRADDMLKVSGIFVSPLEVEGVLLQHPRVLEAAVVGEENEAGLVRPLAYVVLKGHAAEPEPRDEIERALIAHVKARLAHYKAPGRVEFVAELPRSDRGKVLRRALRT